MQANTETVKEPEGNQTHYHIWYVSQRVESVLCSECGQVYPGKNKGPKMATRMDATYTHGQSANVGGKRFIAKNEDPIILDFFVRQCAEDCEEAE